MSLDIEPRTNTVFIGAVNASTAPIYNVFKVPAGAKVRVLAIYLTNGTAVEANASTIHTSTINRLRAASATAIASQTTDSDVAASAAIAADVPWEIPLTSDALAELNAGDVLQWAPTEGGGDGSGDLTEAAITVEYALGYGGAI